jgi:hypothetical protein
MTDWVFIGKKAVISSNYVSLNLEAKPVSVIGDGFARGLTRAILRLAGYQPVLSVVGMPHME